MTHLRTTGSDKTFLRGWEPFNRATKVVLFGELAKLAQPIVQHYLSDLYHDVHWIDDHVVGPCTFYFGCDESGTFIGTDRELAIQGRKNVWEITLTCDDHNGWWIEIKPEAVAK